MVSSVRTHTALHCAKKGCGPLGRGCHVADGHDNISSGGAPLIDVDWTRRPATISLRIGIRLERSRPVRKLPDRAIGLELPVAGKGFLLKATGTRCICSFDSC